MNIQTINHVSDCVPLFTHQSLYLKPSAKFNITVSLPEAITGKTISNWDAMESLRKMIAPDKFSVLKVSGRFVYTYYIYVVKSVPLILWGKL